MTSNEKCFEGDSGMGIVEKWLKILIMKMQKNCGIKFYFESFYNKFIDKIVNFYLFL